MTKASVTTIYHWLVHHGLWNYIVGWTVGAVMTAVVMGIIVRRLIGPSWHFLKKELTHHNHVQDKILDELNTGTPGGLTTINNTLLNMQPPPHTQTHTHIGD